MKIGLIDVDGHARKKQFGATIYPNLALCKISAYHKSNGDVVTWYDPLFTGHCDIVYVSKIFNFTPDVDFFIDADEIQKGGTGYNVESKLPPYIDRMRPDYDIYEQLPKKNAYGFLTRGCPNSCAWCVVPRKEGKIQPYMDVDEIATPTRTNLILMDNNILAADYYAKEQFAKIIERGYRVDFNQAIDARLMTMEFAELMAKMKWIDRRIRFGCDTPKQIQECERSIEMLEQCGFHGEFFLYTIINANFVESYDRIHHWWEWEQETRKGVKRCHVYPNAQPYLNPNKANTPPQWQKDLAGWVNKRMLFTSMDFGDYKPRKGFKCQYYLDTLYTK